MKNIILQILVHISMGLFLAAMIGVVILEIGFAIIAFLAGWATLMLGVAIDMKFGNNIGEDDVRKNV